MDFWPPARALRGRVCFGPDSVSYSRVYPIKGSEVREKHSHKKEVRQAGTLVIFCYSDDGPTCCERDFTVPRRPRAYLAGIPAHVIQRGNDRCACFFEEDDYRFYLQCLDEASKRYGVFVHAYVLMTNHVHLLLTPPIPSAIPRMIQLLGNRYVQRVNKKYRRSGTLWEGRHKASLVDVDRYLLACYRYIELNPVRARLVSDPVDYPWSSHRHHALGKPDPLIKDHEVFLGLGRSAPERRQHYRELVREGLSGRDIENIRRMAEFSMPLGDERFRLEIEDMLGRAVGRAGRGRPKTESGRNQHI